MKILIVDDSSFKRKSLGYVIERHGHEVLEAGDGEEGLEKARSHMPDLIVSDLLMPRMDGFQFLRNVKKDEQLKGIPFIFYSAVFTGEKDRELSLSLGASGFIESIDKPDIFWQELEEIIESDRCKEGICKPLIGEDEEFLRNYSRIVAIKLEEKIRELGEEIAARHKAEEKVVKLSHAIEQSPVSVFITDAEGNIEYVNPKFTETTGHSMEEVIGKKPDILTSGAAILSDTGWRGEFLAGKKSGETFWEYSAISPIVNDRGDIINFVGVSEDMTERRKLEEQLRHSQKLEAIGQLVGGIAHDFNNILTAVIGFGGIMQMKLRKEDPLTENVEQILEAAERGANLTRSLLAFGRKQPIHPIPLNLHELVERMKKLLSRLIGEDIEIRVVAKDGELTITADPLQMEQILMNLATNARDAMPNGGVLTIEIKREEIDEEFIRAHGYGESGMYALISASDTGAGMDEKTRERIFEPFFTTKEVGKGTGLGLSIVYGIVKQHDGYINVYSEVGKGTTFRIYLPMAEAEAEKATAAYSSAPSSPLTGSETVLVAEDDPSVRRLSKTLLETFGYTVIEAADGEEAVRKYVENKDEIKLLVLDVIMPRMNGKEAYEWIRKMSPSVKAFFMSGYTAEVMQSKSVVETGQDFVSKPIQPTEFMRKVREVLDR